MDRVAILVVLSLVLAWQLVPREHEVVGRLVADGQYERALELFGAEDGTTTTLIRDLIDENQADLNPRLIKSLQTLMAFSEEPGEVYELINEYRSDIPETVASNFLESLAIRSMQLGAPELASRIYQDLSRNQVLDEPQLRSAVTAARHSSNPLLGLNLLSDHLRKLQIPASHFPEDLRRMMITLSREVNQGERAFELLVEELRQSNESGARSRLMEELAQVSVEANRFEEGIPIIKRYVETTQAGQMDWDALVARKGPHPSDPEFMKYASMLATVCEWHNDADQAFDIYRKLALLGDLHALDRCVTIYPWALRQNDLADLLFRLYPIRERSGYSLLIARLQAQRGHFDSAEKILRELIQSGEAQEADLWAELGHVMNELDEFEQAIGAYRKAVDLDSATHGALSVKVAQLHISLGNHAEALRCYGNIPLELHSNKSAEDYSVLAESMLDGAQYERIARWGMKDRPARSQDFAQLADVWRKSGAEQRAREVLEEGLRVLPESDILRLALVDHDIQREAFEPAYLSLQKVFRLGDFRYTSRLLELAQQLQCFGEAIAMLKLEDPLATDWPDQERLYLADLYEDAGEPLTALQIFSDVPGGELGALRIRAEQAFLAGDVQLAWTLQQQYLEMPQPFDPDAWLFMGDLHEAVGRYKESEQAYHVALQGLKRRVASLN